jgi:hypothetical protein
MNDTTLGGIMSRRVYSPSQDRTYHNGIFKDAKELNPIDDTEFCTICDALTLHMGGLCVRCYPKRTSQIVEQNQSLTKSNATNNKKST